MPLNTRGEEERCSATRVCEVMSRRREPRAIQRSKVMERARWAGAKLDGIAETGVVGAGEDGLKVEIRTGEENQLHVESILLTIRTGHQEKSVDRPHSGKETDVVAQLGQNQRSLFAS